MAGEIEADLMLAVQEWAVGVVSRAVDVMVADVRNDPTTPRATGRLAGGIRAGQIRRTGTTIEADIESFALSQDGFDYPEFIDQTARVMPTRRRFLRFEIGGRTVYSRGFENPHRGWWKKTVTEQAWVDALTRAAGS